jgi:Icc-related predicted phosphoesterase
MRIVTLSDTHNRHDEIVVPAGDLLVHAGDLTGCGTLPELEAAARWLRSLPHPHKVVIAGNHDFALERRPAESHALFDGLTYLQDSGTSIGGLRIWGSPWQPRFFDWAFNLDRGPAIRAKWDLIPSGIDVLVTHGPPAGILDETVAGQRVGCADLLVALRRVRPRLHVFGHIHESYGRHDADGTHFLNASSCDLRYEAVNRPLVVDLDPRS